MTTAFRAWQAIVATALAGVCLTAIAAPALPIDLEVAAEPDAPFGALQEWSRVLAELDLDRLRLRGARGDDKPAVTVTGDGAAKRYHLVGVLNNRNQLVLPGGRFGQGNRAKLREFFEQLPQRLNEQANPRGRFGLTFEQFEQVFADLSQPVTEPTLDGAPQELVPTLTKAFAMPVRGGVETKAALRAAPPFRAQMKGLTVGTTLAAVLRSANLQFVPNKLGNDPLTIRVRPLDAADESWPVGWKPLGSPRQIAPAMYRVTNVEIENFTLDKALEALAPHMGVPLVFDQRVLAERKIDPATIPVRYPRRKIFVRGAVDNILTQGRLSGELRIDEAGQPFYWITQFGAASPRATETTRASTEK